MGQEIIDQTGHFIWIKFIDLSEIVNCYHILLPIFR